jgi:two-component system sensor kinase FixL
MDRESDAAAETRLAEARFWLAAITESSDDAIVGKDLRGVVMSWNKAAETTFGFAADEIVGRPITLIVPPTRIEEEATILSRIRKGERIVHFETERQRKDGKIIPVALTVSPIRDGEGRIIGASKIARDLSEMQRVLRDLGGRKGLLGAILDAAPDALVVIDKQGLMQSFSAAATRMFGFSSEEAIGQNVSMLMPSPDRERHDSYLARYLATGERRIIGIGREVVGRRKDGTVFPMELSVGEVNLPGTQLFAGFIRDLSKRRDREHRLGQVQAELLHVSRVAELGQMVSALAHEVSQPLAAIGNYLGGIRRLLDSGNNPQGVQKAMETALGQVNRAHQIIQRIRDQVSNRQTERQVESLSQTIEEARDLVLIGANREIKLEIRVDADASEAVIDKVQIQQVLVNLMRNAAEAMAGSARRELVISTARAGDMVEISVADTGPGLPDTVRARLFQPFVTTKLDGMGVGLSVCRTIIEAHQGELLAEDGADGGTVFRFTVPHSGKARPA